MLRPVPGLVRTRGQRVALHATDVAAVTKIGEVDVGNCEIRRGERASIDAQALRVNLVINAKELGEARKAEAAFKGLAIAEARGSSSLPPFVPAKLLRN